MLNMKIFQKSENIFSVKVKKHEVLKNHLKLKDLFKCSYMMPNKNKIPPKNPPFVSVLHPYIKTSDVN